MGDIDGDNVADVAVGRYSYNTTGAVFLRFLNADGTVKDVKQIGNSLPGCGELSSSGMFGSSVENVGDMDGNGVNDIAVGSSGSPLTPPLLFILSLDNGGNVISCVSNALDTIPQTYENVTSGRFEQGSSISLHRTESFGFYGILCIGEKQALNIDAIGKGEIHFFHLAQNGTLYYMSTFPLSAFYASDGSSFPNFGISVEFIDDLDGDGTREVAIGSESLIYESTPGEGGVFVAFFDSTYSVLNSSVLIKQGINGGPSEFTFRFGSSIANIGDIDGDGVNELVVGDFDATHIFILYLNTDATVKRYTFYEDTAVMLPSTGFDYVEFGIAISSLGDTDGNGVDDIAVGFFRVRLNTEPIFAFAILRLSNETRVCGVDTTLYGATNSTPGDDGIAITVPALECTSDEQCAASCACSGEQRAAFCQLP